MHAVDSSSSDDNHIADATARFYREVLEAMNASGADFLIGGAYAFHHYTGISRNTKDLDLFIHRGDYERVSAALADAGYETDMPYPHWLAKAHRGEDFVDIIFDSANGIATVDDAWFSRAPLADVFGLQIRISPVEEMIWSKAFIMERERYDGADIAHLIRACGDRIDWRHLLDRFGHEWRILLNHLLLFGFVYPDRRDLVPTWLMDQLIDRLRQETHAPPPAERICYGTILSREQYLPDIRDWGYRDGRLAPNGRMRPEDVEAWTEAIDRDSHAP